MRESRKFVRGWGKGGVGGRVCAKLTEKKMENFNSLRFFQGVQQFFKVGVLLFPGVYMGGQNVIPVEA